MDEYSSTVLDYLNFCTDTLLTTKTIKVLQNQKPWLDSNVWSLLRARDAAYRTEDTLAYSNARKDLKKGIREAKYRYKQRNEGYFTHNDNPRTCGEVLKP